MFKYLADFLNPRKRSLSLIKSYRATDINKIRLYHGPIFDLAGAVEGISFFMTENLAWEGRLNRSVQAAAGSGIDEYILNTVDHPQAGEVFPLPGFSTPFQALFMGIVHEWDGGIDFEDRDLVRCYRESVNLAALQGLTKIAFPAMGRDKREFPHIRFARLAVEGIASGLAASPSMQSVTVACSDKRMMETYQTRLNRRGWKLHK